MAMLIALTPWLLSMGVLILGSAFFSASETALFSLREGDRRELKCGTRAQQAAAALLKTPDLLLSAVLFWNLMINMAYFAVASIVGFQLSKEDSVGATGAYGFAIGSLITIIFFSEMLPKSLGVVSARRLSAWVSLPLTLAVRVVSPLMPFLRSINTLSQRIIWPRFQREPYLEIADLEQAIEASTSDAKLIKQEQIVLRNVVGMSDIRVDEWMRPRTQLAVFPPPVSLADLRGQMTPSGYLLITEQGGDELAAAVDLQRVAFLPEENIETLATPLCYLPWCATVADAFEQMTQRDCDVIAVVNEHGETVGIVTFEDILDTVLLENPTRSERLLSRKAIHEVGDGVWQVIGVTSLKRLSRQLGIPLPPSKNTTLAGVIQEMLQKIPDQGDRGSWGRFDFLVLEAVDRAHTVIELTLARDAEDEEGDQ